MELDGREISRVALVAHLVRDAIRAATVRRGRAIALAGAVAVATALVVATVSLSQTASAQVSDRFDARRNREVTLRASLGYDLLAETSQGHHFGLPLDAEERAQGVAGVEASGVMVDGDPQPVATRPTQPTELITVLGVSPGLVNAVGGSVEWVPGHRRDLGAREALIGEVAASRLQLDAREGQATVLINGVRFAVAGVVHEVERDPTLLGAVMVPLDEVGEVAGPVQLSIVLRTASGAAQQVARQAPIALDPVTSERFEVESPPDLRTLRAEIESDIGVTLLILSAVALLGSVVGIANAMTMGVVERTGEFGLRRAIGASRAAIVGQVATEAAVLGVLGGIAGLYLGLGGILGVTLMQRWQPVFDFRVIPLAIIGGAIVGMVGGLAAASRASRIEPVDALRR